MNKHAYWAWAIKNCTVVICFTVLALTFNKWWIVLFASLFLSDLRTSPTMAYYRICDSCGTHSPHADTPEAALKAAEKAPLKITEKAPLKLNEKLDIKRIEKAELKPVENADALKVAEKPVTPVEEKTEVVENK